MKKKFAWKILVVAIAMVLSLCMLVACCEKPTPPADVDPPIYVPLEALEISIDVMDGTTKLGTITNATLAEITAENITMSMTKNNITTITTYVAYSFSAIMTKLSIALPTFEMIKCEAKDDAIGLISQDNITNSYLTVAVVENGVVKADEASNKIVAPRFIPDKNKMIAKDIMKEVFKITF